MKSIIMFYSYGGSTKKLAEKMAKEEGAALAEIKTKKRHGMLWAFFAGCPAAMRQKSVDVQPLPDNLDEYGNITIMGPIWARHPAPPLYNAIAALPSGKDVRLVLVSSSGESPSREKTIALVEGRGCRVVKYEDVKTPQ